MMKRMTMATALLMILALAAPAVRAGTPADKQSASALLAAAKAEAKKATDDYKASLTNLLSIYEGQRKDALARVTQLEELFEAQVASRREVEEARSKVAELDAEIAKRRAQLVEADATLAEILAEPAVIYIPRSRGRAPLRSLGAGSWSIATAGLVQSFYQGRFGRSLPVSAYGQTETHNRLGWNHTNAVDVAVSPDSAEGQALIAFLREKGIPFIAFRSAISGVATGPHIHIGLPSSRL